jgi:hypothetical protein
MKHLDTSNRNVNSLATFNPYRMAYRMVRDRLQFDLSGFALKNYRALRALRDSQTGKKCVILCNGPSLNKVDFDQLSASGVYTIGLNKINFLFDRTTFRPSVIASVNPLVIQQNLPFFQETKIPVFLDYDGLRSVNARYGDFKNGNLYVLKSSYEPSNFARDISVSVPQGYTVTYVALQLAYHLGFQQVAVVGCDHYFKSQGTPNALIQLSGDDPNHFAPNYFSEKDKWQLPDLVGSELNYQVARENYFGTGREVYNCTEGGHLEQFPRLSLTDFLTR